MKNIELLSPVGDFECLKAAVQNGADAVYLGASQFSARASAKNFDLDELAKAISYAKLRNVSVHLTLNTLLKNDELNDALKLVKSAYELGIDAIIVQDFGLCRLIHKYFPDLEMHGSTQMTIHNLEGAQELQDLGFTRAVLSRELSISEIEFIHNNVDIELETFIHGALCISYSGQCLLSSMIGGRSGNRGKCAQACRLPYSLIDSEKVIDSGYLLSPKDLCGLDFIPNLIDIGVSSLKIEGRMKTPEYVATVTRIYRKYIDLALSGNDYIIDEKDKQDLLQVFNRGGFSSGHLDNSPNKDLIFKEKPNNMGIYIGNVAGYNPNKGHISLNLNSSIKIGDTICFEHENSKYRISELMLSNKNIESAHSGQLVKIGRMKGNIKPSDKIYKLESKTLSDFAKNSYSKDFRKTFLNCNIIIKKDLPIELEISSDSFSTVLIHSEIIPTIAINSPISKERIIAQFSKTGNTPFEFKNINIDLEDGLFISISDLNALRRNALSKLEDSICDFSSRKIDKSIPSVDFSDVPPKSNQKKVSLLLNILDENVNYSELSKVDRIYIPLKYFAKNSYSNVLKNISNSFPTYIYMPNIIKANYRNIFTNNIDQALNTYNIKGFVLSNIGTFEMLEKYKNNFDFIGNYTLNIYNNASIENYKKLGLKSITLSPELNKENIHGICSKTDFPCEIIVYGNTPVMTMGYCLLGKSNKCYPDCTALCKNNKKYYLKDRLGFTFRVLPDPIQTITTLYNSKITSIDNSDLAVDSIRIDILDENILEINNIIDTVTNGNRLDGKDYTNGNFNRDV